MATSYPSNAVRPVAGNSYLPESLEARGTIKPIPPTNGTRNGQGELVMVGLAAFEWRWAYFTLSEMAFWKSLLGYTGSANYSKRFSNASLPAARLWDIDLSLIAYSSAVIDMPTWADYKNGLFRDCMVRFNHLQL